MNEILGEKTITSDNPMWRVINGKSFAGQFLDIPKYDVSQICSVGDAKIQFLSP